MARLEGIWSRRSYKGINDSRVLSVDDFFGSHDIVENEIFETTLTWPIFWKFIKANIVLMILLLW